MLALALILGMSSATAGQQPETRRFDFDDSEVVEGTPARGEGELMLARKQAHFGKLIRLRTDFVPELLRSADRQ